MATDPRAIGPDAKPGQTAHARSASVGMIGGGQLARMTHRAAIDLGIEMHVLCPSADEPAPAAGTRWHAGDSDDRDALERLAHDVTVVTLDHELVNATHLRALAASGAVVHPTPDVLAFAQDKLFARTELGQRGFPVPAFAAADDVGAVEGFAAIHGWPVVLKTRTGGYDGRGVAVAANRSDAAAIVGAGGTWLVEEHVPIATEIAVLVARAPSGPHATYPLIETVQVDGICTELVMPARVPHDVATRALGLGVAIADSIGATGILAVEMFITPDDRLVINELATRPHNSGHATIEGARTSQFSNHLRAILDWPLGSTAMTAASAVTVNLLGGTEHLEPAGRLPAALSDPTVHVHLYGKTWRPGRKLGHVTVVADDPDDALTRARRAADVLTRP